MLILWRAILLALLHVAVLICFPYYPEYAILTVAIIYIVSVAVMAGITVLLTLLWVGRFWFFNRILDIVMLVLVGIILLFLMPQTNGSVPFDSVSKGQYPTRAEIETGMHKLGIGTPKELKKELEGTVQDVNRGIGAVHEIIRKEVKD